jgi:hypothetical protein
MGRESAEWKMEGMENMDCCFCCWCAARPKRGEAAREDGDACGCWRREGVGEKAWVVVVRRMVSEVRRDVMAFMVDVDVYLVSRSRV